MPQSILTINVANVIKNFRAIQSYVGSEVAVAPTLKCNAYGLGAEKICSSLLQAGCREVYVARLSEGMKLRKIAPKLAIYVLDGVEVGEEQSFIESNLVPVLNNLHQMQVWEAAAKRAGKKFLSCLHIDSGMTRLGIDGPSAEAALKKLAKSECLELIYILSHLACADEVQSTKNSDQLQFLRVLQAKYPQFKYSFANSAGALLLGKDYHCHQVRPGIAIYGGNPAGNCGVAPVLGSSCTDVHIGSSAPCAPSICLTGVSFKRSPIKLHPVVELHSPIIDLHVVSDAKLQASVGYGATHKLKLGSVIATLPVGYGDGYPRRLGNVGHCCINGKRVSIVGRISMDLLCLDISALPKRLQKLGQKVELIGKHISIEEIAAMADTINYEILTALGNRYERKYIGA